MRPSLRRRRMPKINYQIEMEKELRAIQARGQRPLLALHSCCAPCSSAVLERLNAHFRIALYYYNPNISPEAEFRHRVEEQRRLVRQMPLADDLTVAEGPYEPERFYELVRGHEGDPEGGARCWTRRSASREMSWRAGWACPAARCGRPSSSCAARATRWRPPRTGATGWRAARTY